MPEKEIASQIRELQNGFLQNEPFHLQTVAFLLGTPYHAVCRNEYLRWANENTESYLPNLISGVVLLRGRASIPYLERAIAAAPNRKQPYEKLITEYYNLGQFSRAAAVCSNALRIFPDDPDLRVRRAEIRVDNRESASEVLAELKEELSRFCRGLDALVNLIPWNPVPELGFTAPTEREMKAFENALRKLKVNYTIRRSKGQGISGACGQLATDARTRSH